MASRSVQPAVEPRTLRAAKEPMTVSEEARALFEVTTESGSAYTVDLREPACSCPDFQHRQSVEECKHIRRVRIAVGQVDVETLETELIETANELESNATDLEDQARELADTAAELRDVLARLEEVAQ